MGNAFFERHRHAWCRDNESKSEGRLMDVEGQTVYLRARSGLEFTCCLPDLVVVRSALPIPYRDVRYVGEDDGSKRPDGVITELWAMDEGPLATVQPTTGPAWTALLSDLEQALPTRVVTRRQNIPCSAGEEQS